MVCNGGIVKSKRSRYFLVFSLLPLFHLFLYICFFGTLSFFCYLLKFDFTKFQGSGSGYKDGIKEVYVKIELLSFSLCWISQ